MLKISEPMNIKIIDILETIEIIRVNKKFSVGIIYNAIELIRKIINVK